MKIKKKLIIFIGVLVISRLFCGEFFYIKREFIIKNQIKVYNYVNKYNKAPKNSREFFIGSFYIFPRLQSNTSNYGRYSSGEPYDFFLITKGKSANTPDKKVLLYIKNLKLTLHRRYFLGEIEINLPKKEGKVNYR